MSGTTPAEQRLQLLLLLATDFYLVGHRAHHDEMQALVDELSRPPPPPPPVNTAAPVIAQSGAVINCNTGSWGNGPISGYAYQWRMNGSNVSGGAAGSYTVQVADHGKTASCIVTASNAHGSTASPPSNGVVVANPNPTAAVLTGYPVGPIDSLVAGLQPITDGGFMITINGAPRGVRQDFSTITTNDDIAALINGNLNPAAELTIVDVGGQGQFVITSSTTGPASTISYASVPAVATDLSAPLRLTAATGATIAQGT